MASGSREGVCVACVASVSVWFRSKERPRNGILGFGRARNEIRAKKWKWGDGGREGMKLRHDRPSERFSKSRGLSASVSFLSSPPPPRSFTCAIFRAVFDSCSSFFAPKRHGNACYAGYVGRDTLYYAPHGRLCPKKGYPFYGLMYMKLLGFHKL